MKKVTTWYEAYTWYFHTVAKYQRQYRTFEINSRHITNYFGEKSELINFSHGYKWSEFISHLQNNTKLSNNTINKVLTAATTVLNKTRNAGLHDVEVPKFDRPKFKSARLTWFSKNQVDQLAITAEKIFDSKDLADAIIFSAYTGLRQSELLKIKPSDVNLTNKTITIGGSDHLQTKGGEVRVIPLHAKALSVLENRLTKTYLFGNDWINKDQLLNCFKKVRDYNHISNDYVWHSLRHSFGTYLGEVCEARQIMALMGHKDIATSLRYTHVTSKSLTNAISNI